MLGSELTDAGAVSDEYALSGHDEPIGTLVDRAVKRTRKIVRAANVMDLQGNPQGWRRLAHRRDLQRRNWRAQVGQHQHPRHRWHRVLEQLETLSRKLGDHRRHPGNVSPRLGKAVYKPGTYRVAELDHDDRDRSGGSFCGQSGRSR